MRSFSLALSLVVAGCGGGAASVSAENPVVVSEGEVPDELFGGQFAFDGGASERSQIAQSVDTATEEMNFVVRGIARDRLKKTNRAPETIELSRQGEQLTVVIDGRRYEGVLDAKPVTVTGITGDDVEMTYRIAGDQLLQTFRGEDGGRENAFRLVDSDTVVMDVRVFSPRLPADILYSLTYRRGPSAEDAP